VPTERATKTYVDTRISVALAGAGSIVAGSAPNQSKVEVTGAGITSDTIDFEIAGSLVSQIGKEYILVPTGSTAERPGSPANGYLRYNTSLNIFEGYVNGAWSGIGGGNPWSTVSTAGYTAVNNDRLFVDTTGGAFSIALPASPNTGDSVRFLDVAGNFDTFALTIDRNGNNIMGSGNNLTLSTQYEGLVLVYSGATYGWVIQEI
jgi:hypothetical protein